MMAVIECASKSLFIGGIVLLLVLCRAGETYANPKGCDGVREAVTVLRFQKPVLSRPENGPICGDDSCCSADLESDMRRSADLNLDKFFRESIVKLNLLLDTRAKKFDEFFRSIMDTSKVEFHDMFKRTYGKIYIQNSDVFSDFFDELERYYKKGTVRLSETMDTFFGILYQRMFTVLNSQYSFDDSYMECVSNHMQDLNPFGDVSSKLSLQLRRAFVATKMFYKALQTAANITTNLLDYKFSDDCKKELTKMQYCGFCKEKPAKACSDYCSVTMGRCFSEFEEFSDRWDILIGSIEKVAERLLGPYNVEAVVEPINIKISEAIMNFQETGAEVSKKIYQMCGKPALNRQKRRAEYENSDMNRNMEISPDNHRPPKKKQKNNVEHVDNTPTLEKILKEIKTKIHDTQKYWINLPYQYCNNENVSVQTNSSAQCWAGTLDSQGPKDAQSSTLLKTQIYIIDSMNDNLRKAYHGEEVEMIDEELVEGSGSGSGDGYDYDSEDDLPSEPQQPKVIDPVVLSPPRTPSTTREPEVVRTSSAGSTSQMSLTRALVQYVLPIMLAWFGGAITDLL